MDQGKIVFHGTPGELTARGEGHGTGDAPLERGYSAVLAAGTVMTAVHCPGRLPAGAGQARAAGRQRGGCCGWNCATTRCCGCCRWPPRCSGSPPTARPWPCRRCGTCAPLSHATPVPCWSSRAPVVGAAAWMGSREGRRHTADLVTITARPRWARLLAAWAATTCWAMVGYLGCVAVLYGVTAQQAAWGGPLWWPAAVAAASLPALSALGFAAGTLAPQPVHRAAGRGRRVLRARAQHGADPRQPVVLADLAAGLRPLGRRVRRGRGDLLPLPSRPAHRPGDVPRRAHRGGAGRAGPARRAAAGDGCARPAAAITAAGLLAAGTAVALAGTGKLDAHGMIAIPALHDAASDRPVRYTPVCSHTAVPVCLNPAYAGYLPAAAAALAPVLDEMAGLPGAPARVSQAAATYRQGHRQRRQRRPAWPTPQRQAAGVPPAPARPAARAHHDHQRTGRRGAIKRRARHRGQRHRRRPGRIAGAAGGHGGADDAAAGHRPGQPPGSRQACNPAAAIVPRARSPAMPRPGGSPRCRPPPGTPGWCGTWPRCGPAGSPWRSCHDRRRGAHGADGSGGQAPGRPRPAGPPRRRALRLVRLHAASRRVPAAMAAIAACAIGLRIALLGQLGHLRRAAAAAGVRGRRPRRSSPSPPQARSASRNASPAGGCRSCGWPPRWR